MCILLRLASRHVGSMADPCALPAPQSRLSAKLWEAIDQWVRKGVSIAEACRVSGLSSAGWFKAMKREEVRDYMEEARWRYVSEADAKQAHARMRALEVAIDLLNMGKSEAVKAKLIVFLAGDDSPPSPQVVVHVPAPGPVAQVGYAYPPSLHAPRPAAPRVIDDEGGSAPMPQEPAP